MPRGGRSFSEVWAWRSHAVATARYYRRRLGGIGLNAATPRDLGLRKFGELAALRSKGRICVELFASSKPRDELTMVTALRQGTQEITCTDSSTPARVNDFSVVEFPFTFQSEAEADQVHDEP